MAARSRTTTCCPIWSTSSSGARDYPAETMIRFFQNHGLLQLMRRPQWHTVAGGSRTYVERLAAGLNQRRGRPVTAVRRTGAGVLVQDASGAAEVFDRVVIAAHADQALRLLEQPTRAEQEVLGAFRYGRNLAVLHGDPALMPRRRAAWSAWNHLGRRGDRDGFCVTYWMNKLQHLPGAPDLFVTLNPCREPRPDQVFARFDYAHPLFDFAALRAQRRLWSLQGEGGVWFCGAYFGAGFHEDGLQAGLAVAEALGDVRRPWVVPGESDRIQIRERGTGRLAA
jgi:predicted NAD/FAD-binding protein